MITWKPIKFEASIFQRAFNSESECEYWEIQFKNGKALAYNVISDDININIVVRGEGESLVVCLLVGNGVNHVIKAISDRAKEKGFSSIRFHVNTKAKARLFKHEIRKQNLKPRLIEQIYLVKI